MKTEHTATVLKRVYEADILYERLAWIICYEKTGSSLEVCRKYNISRKTFYKWLRRFNEANGDATSLRERSRRPHHCPRATPEPVVSLVKQIYDKFEFGHRRIRQHLHSKYGITLSSRTIRKILRRLKEDQNSEMAHTLSYPAQWNERD